VRVGHVACGMASFRQDGKDTVRFEILVLTFHVATLISVKQYNIEDNRSITGTGWGIGSVSKE